jgi:predicted Zn-dependent protease
MLPLSLMRFAALCVLVCLAQAQAAPYTPASDQQVLETLPVGRASARGRELRALQSALAADPGNLDKALRLARAYFEEVAAEGDPRYIGYAQAALAPWWQQADAPPEARVMRAMLLQFNHGFDPARTDLRAALQAQPDNAEAWAWLGAISLVQADFAQARLACGRLQSLAPPLIARACVAQIDAQTGQSARAATDLRAALLQFPDADARDRLWVLTRLAETEEQRGDFKAAESAFRSALDLQLQDTYLLSAYADFLLDQGRPAEVLALLKGKERSDLLLLRLALAAKATNDRALAPWANDLAARFDAARLRGDTVHQKEESRFALRLQGQPERALRLAGENFAVQREAADARILLEAALAANQPAAAQPALRWLASSGHDSLLLKGLAQKLKGAQ